MHSQAANRLAPARFDITDVKGRDLKVRPRLVRVKNRSCETAILYGDANLLIASHNRFDPIPRVLGLATILE